MDPNVSKPTSSFREQQNLFSFEIKDSDTIVVSYPCSGSSWLEEMVWLLKNNFDYAEAKKPLSERVPTYELDTISKLKEATSDLHKSGIECPEVCRDSFSYTSKLKDPRCFKTHLPWIMLPHDLTANRKQPKIIHIYRYPSEVCLAYYKRCRDDMPIQTFAKIFMSGEVLMGPFWKHVLGYWDQRNKENFLFVKFDDLFKNLPSLIGTVAKFLDVEVSDVQLANLISHLSFDAMKRNPAVTVSPLTKFVKQIKIHSEEASGSSTSNLSAASRTGAVINKQLNCTSLC